MDDRLINLIKNIPEYENDIKIDAALIVSPINRFYFSGFKSSEGFVLVTREKTYFIVDFRYYNSALNCIKGNINVVLLSNLKNNLLEIIKKHNIKNILIENQDISFAEVIRLEKLLKECETFLVKTGTLDKIIYSLREIKSEEEIKNIKIAQEISERALYNLLSFIKPGISEKELAFKLEFLIRKEGAEAISFDLIVASGKNSSIPHAEPTNKPIESGDFITIDMGAVYNGYHSDMTRTFALGNISDEQKNVYETVLKAQNKAIDAIKPGALCSSLDGIAREIINKNGYEGCFEHALGHGVGLNIHEGPILSSNTKDILKPGMIITVEPGIYLGNSFGVRIEDMILITNDGYKNLTAADKRLIIL